MRAVGFRRHGGPEVLEAMDLPEPRAASGEVVVAIRACALNHLDLIVRGGLPNLRLTYPHILGSDIAGMVEGVGAGVRDWSEGDRVVVDPGLSDGRCEYCRRGEDSLCEAYRILGEHVPGGYAEYIAVPARNLLPMPKGLDFPQAAAIPLVFMTAWRMLVHRAQVRPGEDVLVVGASGGVSSAAIQIAHAGGARVFAVSRSADKLAKAKELGADVLINSSEVAFEEEAWHLTAKRGVDVVVENVGQATWRQSLRCLAKGGRLVTCGATTGATGEVDIRLLFSRQIALLGSTMGSHEDLKRVLALVELGRLRPVVDVVLPLAEAREAHRRLAAAEHFGKVVLVPEAGATPQ